MTTRRGFLLGMLALGAAPAIVRAESLMKLWVPPQELYTGWDLSSGDDKTAIHIRNTDAYGTHLSEYYIIMHPSAEEAMRGLMLAGSATVIYRREVLHHG